MTTYKASLGKDSNDSTNATTALTRAPSRAPGYLNSSNTTLSPTGAAPIECQIPAPCDPGDPATRWIMAVFLPLLLTWLVLQLVKLRREAPASTAKTLISINIMGSAVLLYALGMLTFLRGSADDLKGYLNITLAFCIFNELACQKLIYDARPRQQRQVTARELDPGYNSGLEMEPSADARRVPPGVYIQWQSGGSVESPLPDSTEQARRLAVSRSARVEDSGAPPSAAAEGGRPSVAV